MYRQHNVMYRLLTCQAESEMGTCCAREGQIRAGLALRVNGANKKQGQKEGPPVPAPGGVHLAMSSRTPRQRRRNLTTLAGICAVSRISTMHAAWNPTLCRLGIFLDQAAYWRQGWGTLSGNGAGKKSKIARMGHPPRRCWPGRRGRRVPHFSRAFCAGCPISRVLFAREVGLLTFPL